MELSANIYALSLLVHFANPASISTLTVVSFVRAKCIPKPDKWCIGTFIFPKFILTTRDCAQACHSIDFSGSEIPAVKIYMPSKPGPRLIRRMHQDSLAIVRVSIDNYNYLKLSALEGSSAIGFKAYIPRLSHDIIKLRPAVVKLCERDSIHPADWYVCTAVSIIDRCKIEQGSPLILDGKVIGIMGLREKRCKYPETAFIAVAPVLSWIQTIIEHDSKQQIFEQRFPVTTTNITTKRIPTSTKSLTTVSSVKTESFTDPTKITASVIENNVTNIENTIVLSTDWKEPTTFFTHAIYVNNTSVITENNITSNRNMIVSNTDRIKLIEPQAKSGVIPVNEIRQSKLAHVVLRTRKTKKMNTYISKKSSSKRILKPAKKKVTLSTTRKKMNTIKTKKLTMVNQTKTTTLITTKRNKIIKNNSPKHNANSTLNKFPESKITLTVTTLTRNPKTITRKINMSTLNITTPRTETRDIVSWSSPKLLTELPTVSKVTSALDWFNKEIRKKLNEKPQVLVLTTARPLTTKEFVDLT